MGELEGVGEMVELAGLEEFLGGVGVQVGEFLNGAKVAVDLAVAAGAGKQRIMMVTKINLNLLAEISLHVVNLFANEELII